jgi:hypothetical protein
LERFDHRLGQRFVERGVELHHSGASVAVERRVECGLGQRRRGKEDGKGDQAKVHRASMPREKGR